MTNIYDPTKCIPNLKGNILRSRHEDLIRIMRENKIYRNIDIPQFIFLNGEWIQLTIWYPDGEDFTVTFRLSGKDWSVNGFEYDNKFITDDEFIMIIEKLDNLINSGIDDIIEEMYYHIDDQQRIDYIKEYTGYSDDKD